MAEVLMKKYIKNTEIEADYKISSAGLYASDGETASPKSVNAVKRFGLDLSTHRSVQLDAEIVQKAFLILTMTNAQKIDLVRTFPNASDKTFVLSEYACEDTGVPCKEIIDPYGLGQDVYDQTLAILERYIRQLILRLQTKSERR
jgi:protein-tyrosine-phosphatase